MSSTPTEPAGPVQPAEDAPTHPNESSPSGSPVRLIGRTIVQTISVAVLLFTVAIVTAVGIAPRIMHAEALVVLSQSMEPTIKAGDTVIVQPDAQYALGDVVTYQRTSGKADFVTHRVLAKSFTGGKMMLTLKGDNNTDPDKPIKAEQVRGKVVYTVPKTGFLTESLREKPLLTNAVIMLIVGLSAYFAPALPRLRRRTPAAAR